jgi:putative two-component system response regulator
VKRARILIVEDQLGPRKSLEMILNPFFDTSSVDKGEDALKYLKQQSVDLVTLDLRLPDIRGVDLLRQIKRAYQNIEVIIITGYGELKSAMDAMNLGASCYLLKPFNIGDVISAVNRAIDKKKRFEQLKAFLSEVGNLIGFDIGIGEGLKKLKEDPSLLEKIKQAFTLSGQEIEQENRVNYFEFIRILIETLEKKDPYARGHSSRVNYYSNLIAQQLNLTPLEKEELQMGTYLHDIGKLGISQQIIQNRNKYTPDEAAALKRHPEIGVNLIEPLSPSPNVLSVIRHHHEFYDGSGYPDGFKGKEIPLLARIVGIADAFDSMTCDYPYEYRKTLSLEEAGTELQRFSGKQFDPDIVKVLTQIIRDDKEKLVLKPAIPPV